MGGDSSLGWVAKNSGACIRGCFNLQNRYNGNRGQGNEESEEHDSEQSPSRRSRSRHEASISQRGRYAFSVRWHSTALWSRLPGPKPGERPARLARRAGASLKGPIPAVPKVPARKVNDSKGARLAETPSVPKRPVRPPAPRKPRRAQRAGFRRPPPFDRRSRPRESESSMA